jgi:hypothetical protein
MMLVATVSKSYLFLNQPKNGRVLVIEVSDTSRPTIISTHTYDDADRAKVYHLIEHYGALLQTVSAGRDAANRPHTLTVVDLTNRKEVHGADERKTFVTTLPIRIGPLPTRCVRTS